MKTTTAGQEPVADVAASVPAGHQWGFVPEMSDVALLVHALVEAEEARAAGKILGPAVSGPEWDQVGWTRTVRRATRRDLARLRTALGGAA
jgi:hypothetical protein